ncbi:MAG: 3-dehydroquinate synthase [Nitrospiraceae bacterium]|nr:3-dehydroquinate synthase [Nitrospiraceae bacterium]
MQKIRVDLGDRSYNILIDTGNLPDIGKSLLKFEFSKKICLLSNPTVFGLYGAPVSRSIRDEGFELAEILIPDGEEYKNLGSVEQIYGEMLKARLDRKSVLVALGGGVIGDMAGFAASTYMRGIDFVQVPTTLLAQVDSSVGGKTGVNHALGKNMIGTFWQPRLVWVDTDTLKTLPKREFLSGLAEVIKYGVIWDAEFFRFLEENVGKVLAHDKETLGHIIRVSCEIKAEVVSRDERESGLRAILNYGHTIGHAIETATGYTRFLHGEAVAIGMYAEAKLAQQLGLLDGEQAERIKAVIGSYGLPSAVPEDIAFESVLSSMQLDKKALSGDLRFVLPERIGSVKIKGGLGHEEIEKVFAKSC